MLDLQLRSICGPVISLYVGSFPLTVTVTTMSYRSYKNPPNKAPLRTVTGRGNHPTFITSASASRGPPKKPSTLNPWVGDVASVRSGRLQGGPSYGEISDNLVIT